MKQKLTLTIDENVIVRGKLFARQKGVSLSNLVEEELSRLEPFTTEQFLERWEGVAQLPKLNDDDERYERLVRKHVLSDG